MSLNTSLRYLSPDISPNASAQELLDGLRVHLTPSPILLKLPSALQIFAHLNLISERIHHQANHALRLGIDIGKSLENPNSTANGSLDHEEIRKLKRLIKRHERRNCHGFSLSLKKLHLAIITSTKIVTPKGVFQLLDAYFPSRSEFEASDNMFKYQLSVQTMTENEWDISDVYRSEVMVWYERLKISYAAGQPRMTFKEMMRTDDKSLDQLDLLVRKILELSEGIVRDAEELMAMFDEEADGNVAGRVVKEEEESDHGRDFSRPPPRADSSAGPSNHAGRSRPLQRLLNTGITETRSTSSREATTITHRPAAADRPTATQRVEANVPAQASVKRERSSSPIPISPPRNYRRPIPTQRNSGPKSMVPRRAPKPAAPPPDYTKPIGKFGGNVTKGSFKPFDQKELRPSRPAEIARASEGIDSGSKKRARIQVDEGHREEGRDKRKVLVNKGNLENSQSSGESQETKNRRRVEKGKGREDGRMLNRKTVDQH